MAGLVVTGRIVAWEFVCGGVVERDYGVVGLGGWWKSPRLLKVEQEL